jgi:mannan polymerase II complex MNN11 subunit
MAIVDQRLMNAYNKGAKDALYQNGDLAVRFPDCEASGGETCVAETESFVQAWRRLFEIS